MRKTQMRKCKENQKILKLGLRGEERRGEEQGGGKEETVTEGIDL